MAGFLKEIQIHQKVRMEDDLGNDLWNDARHTGGWS